MNNLFSPMSVVALAVCYALLMVFLTYLLRGYARSKEGFFVAGRRIGLWESSFSIAATWIWAPALFVGAQQAYTNGWVGVFWFTVPNVLCLVLFSWFAAIVREKLPNGYTFSQFVRNQFSFRCQVVYISQFVVLAVCSYAVQILAGASVIKILTGMPLLWASLLLSAISLAYTVVAGLKISVVSDILKMSLIFLVGIPLVLLVVDNAGGWQTVQQGMAGINGKTGSLFSDEGIKVFLTFGLPSAIGLFAGPFGDQSFWQRAFSADKKIVKRSFVFGALIFGVVPLVMSLLGFVAAGKQLNVPSVQNTNVFAIFSYVGETGVFLFLAILMAGLVGTLDSRLASIASLAGHDFVSLKKQHTPNDDKTALKYGRFGMGLLAVISIAVANIPGIEILHLFLLYGQIRAATMLPTILAVLGVRISEAGVFWGIISSFVVGLPVFAYGNFNKDWHYIVAGSLFTVLASAIIALLHTKFLSPNSAEVPEGASV